MQQLSSAELEAGLGHVRGSPSDHGTVALIVCRPAIGDRQVLDEADLVAGAGLVGDTWPVRRRDNAAPDPDKQLTLMNDRAALLMADESDRRKLAGDQLYVDLDLSAANLPAGSRLQVGSAIIEVSDRPHLGCAKFAARFGQDAWRFVNSRVGRELRLRGLNARIVSSGTVRAGDPIRKWPAEE